ncbi:STAS domain-containing protein [Shewanella sp. JM162201]|uniref:Anti-sigma factor antagonist n=1 Tax=Shewanella jiangmenensis TaxID=2837387 RepID=A0ABS5UY09_9GAMM|nr:STAS domain-containing protein [Shewanella jiangmenensis]MBT1442983.1 STAS domain-containing protein [Shewanella jiangmenensis]
MKFHPLPKSHASLITLPNEMVMAQTPTHRAALLKHMESGATSLVLDLTDVRYMDSSGLSVLVSVYKRSRELCGEVVLVSPSDGVRALIELTRLHQIFDIYEDRQAAIRYITARENPDA